MSAQKRKSCELDSSSDEEPRQKEVQSLSGRRHSQRIETRRRRTKFRLPSREEVWNSISSENSSPLKYNSPRKTVSDFTKVYNTYNFDDWEDTSDDDEENFLTESSGNSGDSTDDERKTTGTRLKNYHRRIRVESSSSDDGVETKEDKSMSEPHQKAQLPQDEGNTFKEGSDKVKTTKNDSSEGEHNDGGIVWPHNCNEHDKSDSDEMTPCKGRRNVSVLVSDDDENNAAAAATAAAVSCEESNPAVESTAEPMAQGGKSRSSSDSECDSSGDEESDSSGDEGESRASRLRRKSRKVFQQFKEAQAKRKMFLEGKTT